MTTCQASNLPFSERLELIIQLAALRGKIRFETQTARQHAERTGDKEIGWMASRMEGDMIEFDALVDKISDALY